MLCASAIARLCPFCPIPLLRRTVAPAQGIISILGLECTGTGRPYVPAFSLSGTVPAFTCDCLRFYAATKVRPVCLSTCSRTMLAFGNNVSSCSSGACSTPMICRR